MELNLPESVGRYLYDQRVRSAVDLLLSAKRPKMPDGITWIEVPKFYRACLAAQQTRVEWALMLEELWRNIWDDLLDGWTLQPPAQSDVAIDLDDVWDGSFTREYVRQHLQLWPTFECNVEHGFRVGAWLHADGVRQAIEAMGLVEHDGWYYSSWMSLREGAPMDLSPLKEDAVGIIAAIGRVAA